MTGPGGRSEAIHPLLAERWSARGFHRERPLAPGQLERLLEAARWAPSSRNSQPWRFLAVRRHEPAFDRLLGTLSGSNRQWAADAGALILVAAETVDEDGRRRGFAAYDVGGAVAHLTVQAQAEGLAVCQMGGFDASAASEEFGLEARLEPLVVLAVGTAAAEKPSLRWRKPLADLVLPVEPAPVRQPA